LEKMTTLYEVTFKEVSPHFIITNSVTNTSSAFRFQYVCFVIFTQTGRLCFTTILNKTRNRTKDYDIKDKYTLCVLRFYTLKQGCSQTKRNAAAVWHTVPGWKKWVRPTTGHLSLLRKDGFTL
jgi:hypothetical protein